MENVNSTRNISFSRRYQNKLSTDERSRSTVFEYDHMPVNSQLRREQFMNPYERRNPQLYQEGPTQYPPPNMPQPQPQQYLAYNYYQDQYLNSSQPNFGLAPISPMRMYNPFYPPIFGHQAHLEQPTYFTNTYFQNRYGQLNNFNSRNDAFQIPHWQFDNSNHRQQRLFNYDQAGNKQFQIRST